MRRLTKHRVNGINDGLTIMVDDEPGHGGACHEYSISYRGKDGYERDYDIDFQNGTLPAVGNNGVTHESLLAILIDRLECFQNGPYACEDNQEALEAMRKALEALNRRTIARMLRGVEGTHKV